MVVKLTTTLVVTALLVSLPSSVLGRDRQPSNLRQHKSVKTSIQRVASMPFGCPGVDPGEVEVSCTHVNMEKRYGAGLDCTERLPRHTRVSFVRCPVGMELVENYTFITCKFPGKWDNDMFSCDEPVTIETTLATTIKTITKAKTTTKTPARNIATTKKPTTKPATINSTPKHTILTTTNTSSITTHNSSTPTTLTPPTSTTLNTTSSTVSSVGNSSTATNTTTMPGAAITLAAISATSTSATTIVPDGNTSTSGTTTTTAPTTTNTIPTSTTNTAPTTTTNTAPTTTNNATTTTTTTTTKTPTTTPTNTALTSTTTTSAPTTTAPTTTTTGTTVDGAPTTTTVTTTTTPDYLPRPSSESSYKLYRGTLSWNDGQEKCIKDGAHLPVLNSRAEIDYLLTFANQASFMVGINDKAIEGTWVAVDGSEVVMTSLPWAPYQPDNWASIENCVYLTVNSSTALLNDISCTWAVAKVTICEKRIPAGTGTAGG